MKLQLQRQKAQKMVPVLLLLLPPVRCCCCC